MKITDIRCLYFGNSMLVKVDTDDGVCGYGEATFTARQRSVEEMVMRLGQFLIGQDPLRTDFLWYDMLRGTARRGGYIIMTGISGIDEALWDIKGKAYGVPVYQLLGGRQRDRIAVYKHINGQTTEALVESAKQAISQGYRYVRFSMPEAENDVFDTRKMVRLSAERMAALREAVGADVELIYDGHSRFNTAWAAELCNLCEDFHPLFMEDPLIADDLEDYRTLRGRTSCALGTGEKLGPIWDYTTLIGDRLIDYVRTDICNCGGITSMKKIAVYAESAHMDMVPHGLRTPVGMMSAYHVNLSTPNFLVQEQGLFEGDYSAAENALAAITCDARFNDGCIYLSDTPGLGVHVDETQQSSYSSFERPHWRKTDGTVQDW